MAGHTAAVPHRAVCMVLLMGLAYRLVYTCVAVVFISKYMLRLLRKASYRLTRRFHALTCSSCKARDTLASSTRELTPVCSMALCVRLPSTLCVDCTTRSAPMSSADCGQGKGGRELGAYLVRRYGSVAVGSFRRC